MNRLLSVISALLPLTYSYRAYHGTEDNIVPIIESEKMVRALQVCNGNAKLIRLVGQGHGIESVYHDSSFYSCIFSYRRKPGQKSDADSLCYRLYTGITLSADSLVAIRLGDFAGGSELRPAPSSEMLDMWSSTTSAERVWPWPRAPVVSRIWVKSERKVKSRTQSGRGSPWWWHN